MTDVRHILVLPDRDAAEEVARQLAPEGWDEAASDDSGIQLVREELAGEEDAEDAQWLVVLDDPGQLHSPDALDALAHEHDGWLER